MIHAYASIWRCLMHDITRFDVCETLCPNRCLYIKVAELRTGVGSAETSYLPNCSVKLFKEHFKVQREIIRKK